MESRESKLRKLNELRRSVPSCSKAALDKILTEVEKNGVPETHNPKAMREAARHELSQWNGYGNLLLHKEAIQKNGESLTFSIVNLLGLLHGAYKMGAFFYQLVQRTIASKGAPSAQAPWTLLLYSDECYPGNPLGHRQEKKLWCCYASFKEFGQRILSMEDAWLLVMVAKSSQVAKLAGHMSQVMKILLLEIFCSEAGSPADIGIILQGPQPEERLRFWFQFGVLIQDGSAQKFSYGIKGDSGSKFCLKCSNQTCILLPGEEDEENAICPAKMKKELILATNEDVYQSFDRLSARLETERPAIFKAWEQATGWTYTQHGLMYCQQLRQHFKPVDAYMHDWMHGVCQGVLNILALLVLESLQVSGLDVFKSLAAYCNLFILPGIYKSCRPFEIVSKMDTHRKAKRLKVSASDMLTVYPLLRYYVLTCGKHADCQAACSAFLSGCLLLDLLLCTMYEHIPVTGEQLDSAVEACLCWCHKAGWQKSMIKKFHWLLHYGDSLNQHGCLIPCWSMERKHKRITSTATRIQNLKHFESSVYTEVLADEVYRLQTKTLPAMGLGKPSRASKKVQHFIRSIFPDIHGDILTSSEVRLQDGTKALAQDVVLIKSQSQKWDCGKLRLNFANGNGAAPTTFCLVAMYTLLEINDKTGSAKWKETEEHCVIPVQDLLCAVVYSKLQNAILTLIPYHFK